MDIHGVGNITALSEEDPIGLALEEEPFAAIEISARKQLREAAVVCQCEPNAVLFREGEASMTLWMLREGWVRLTKQVSGTARPLTLDIVTPKDNLCGLSAFFDMPYMATAVAVAPVRAVCLPSESLRPLLASSVTIASAVARMLNGRYRHLAAVYATAFASAETKITAALARLEEDFGSEIPITRREIAEMTGTAVETAIRITRKMERAGILRLIRGEIVVVQSLLRRSRPPCRHYFE